MHRVDLHMDAHLKSMAQTIVCPLRRHLQPVMALHDAVTVINACLVSYWKITWYEVRGIVTAVSGVKDEI